MSVHDDRSIVCSRYRCKIIYTDHPTGIGPDTVDLKASHRRFR
jgi:hypothetical protein